MKDLSKEQQETLLQTIKCHLERNEKGDIKWVPDPNGAWNVAVIDKLPTSGMVRYFTPAYQIGFDPYSVGLFSEPSPKASIMQIRLLEREARRHFPQMDSKAVAEYVSRSIETANKK